jgi:uncharacterized protein (TIGR02145 family)
MKWYLKCLKQYADFSGRARRKEFWMFVFFNLIFAFVAADIDRLVGTANPELSYGVFYVLYSLAVFVPGLAVGVRRLHDVGKSGWFLLIALIPLIGPIWLLVLLVTDSNSEYNQYGPNPKEYRQAPKKDQEGFFTDPRDGKVYKIVKIGKQVWMAENLAYKSSRGNYWAYGNDQSNVTKYGYLYDWETALSACPPGWHLPTNEEWTALIDYLGGIAIAGGKLKATGNTWNNPNKGATNITGFTALPGGRFGFDRAYDYIGEDGYWWSATEGNISCAWNWFMTYRLGYVSRYNSEKGLGFSVRCLRD